MTTGYRSIIPVNPRGLEKVAESLLVDDPNPNDGGNGGSLEIKGSLLKYIQVGINGIHGKPVVISPFELEGFNNMTYENTHFKLSENNLYMPTPKIFMTHFVNVMNAYTGKTKLKYADNSEVPKDVVNDLYLHFIKNHKNVYGRSDVGAWTWLNARFVQGSGFNGLDLETVMGVNKKAFQVDKKKLVNCVGENGVIVDLDFNAQGLAKTKSSNQSHVKGQNIYFWQPVKDMVARFNANSDWAYLYCYWDPSDTGDALGVFGCAEGTPRAKN